MEDNRKVRGVLRCTEIEEERRKGSEKPEKGTRKRTEKGDKE
jgi:hypothetical protein